MFTIPFSTFQCLQWHFPTSYFGAAAIWKTRKLLSTNYFFQNLILEKEIGVRRPLVQTHFDAEAIIGQQKCHSELVPFSEFEIGKWR